MEVNDTYRRSLEDVELVRGHAKLEAKELRGLSQVIYMADESQPYRLMELNSDILNSLKEGKEVVFRGGRTSKAVLCTETATYDVKEAETSNSLLLIPEIRFPESIPCESSPKDLEVKEIVGIYHEYLEVRHVVPSLVNIRKELQKSPYRGPEVEWEVDQASLHDFEGLLEIAQMSRTELKTILQDLGAFEISGKWRVMDDDYHFRVLGLFLNLVDENSWDLQKIPLGDTLECLSDLMPKEILEHLLEMYLDSTDNPDCFALKEDKVSRFLGMSLLRPVSMFNLRDFLRAWAESVPEGIKTDLKQLEGLALVELDSRPQVISYFPEDKLPEDIQERLQVLFAKRLKWTLDEISPYIRRLASGKQTVNAILTKFARAYNINGVKYYSSRHGK